MNRGTPPGAKSSIQGWYTGAVEAANAPGKEIAAPRWFLRGMEKDRIIK
jgi:hypothetical protein